MARIGVRVSGRRTRIGDLTIRHGGPDDVEPAVQVWISANSARRGGLQPLPGQEARTRGYVVTPGAFLLVAESCGEIVGMALGMQALANDGAGPPVEGLCHISMVFVAPERWGRGIGGGLVDALLAEARAHGYHRAQLWTQADNPNAQRLYEGRGFLRSGREKEDLGEWIFPYERAL